VIKKAYGYNVINLRSFVLSESYCILYKKRTKYFIYLRKEVSGIFESKGAIENGKGKKKIKFFFWRRKR